MRRISLRAAIAVTALGLFAAGCASTGQTVALVGGIGLAGAILGGQAPGNEIEQVYYLGVFDPQEQVPPTIYRLRVHGQASTISNVGFASGWVPAALSDSLTSDIRLDPNVEARQVTATGERLEEPVSTSTARRLVLFGPEGFREAPRNHRLVIVMGSSPEAYFQAIDQVLGAINPSRQAIGNLKQQLFDELTRTTQERRELERIRQRASEEAS